MRYLIKFTKESHIKFISHLDVMRTIQKIFRRTELPVKYSKGFNPHMILSIAQPLSVGVYSIGEYLDIEFTEEVSEKEALKKFNKCAPSGIKALKVVKVRENEEGKKKVPQAMAAIDAAKYTIKIKYTDTSSLEEDIKKMNEEETWEILKKSKKGEKIVDIKPMIKKIKYDIKDDVLTIDTTVECGSRGNLSSDLLANYIKKNTKCVKENAFVEVERKELYAYKNKKLVSLDKVLI